MMTSTERYEIIFNFTDNYKFSNEFVAFAWKLEADRIYKRTGIYVDAVSNGRTIVGIGDILQEACIVVIVMRNPTIVSSKDDYFDALKAVLATVKDNLNNPYTTLSFAIVEAAFFNKV